MKKILSFLIFGLGILIIFVLLRVPSGYRRELEKRDVFYQGQIDSINALIETTRAQDALLQKRIVILRDSLNIQISAAETQMRRYIALKNKRPVRRTDKELDSLLRRYR